jgi:antitoxin FitA
VAAISIRDLDDDVRDRIRVLAAEHGRSMEAEMRAILTAAVTPVDESPGLVDALLTRFGALGGVDLELAPRRDPPRAAEIN